jgi:multimeric flavodoxin WrbA
VYHSGFGHTRVIAEAIAAGVREAGGEASVVSVEALGPPAPPPAGGSWRDKRFGDEWTPLMQADAVLFGSPTYMGTVSAPFKAFMDLTSAIWGAQRWKDKLAGGFTVSSSHSGDKLHALTTLAVFAAQHSMIWAGPAQMPAGSGEDDINRLGSFLGLMAQADHDKGPDVHPPAGDRESARLFGVRIVELARRLRHAQRHA